MFYCKLFEHRSRWISGVMHRACGRSFAEIAGSNRPVACLCHVCVVCCQLKLSGKGRSFVHRRLTKWCVRVRVCVVSLSACVCVCVVCLCVCERLCMCMYVCMVYVYVCVCVCVWCRNLNERVLTSRDGAPQQKTKNFSCASQCATWELSDGGQAPPTHAEVWWQNQTSFTGFYFV
jgi:hypothetical protein